MKKNAFTTMAVLFLLAGFTHATVVESTSDTRAQPFTVSSSALIDYSEARMRTLSGWTKTITWSDGTKENIMITDKGKIWLNGIEKKPFGFSFLGWMSISDATIETILDWMDSQGVRFVDIYFNTDVDGLTSKIDFYLSKFYSHKKFVRCIIAPEWTSVFTRYSEWQTRFDVLVDQICTNVNWANMVYSVEVTHEPALVAKMQARTLQTLSSTLDAYYSHASNKLSSSHIGSVPIIHAECIWANPSDKTYRDYWKVTLDKTDIIKLDDYPEDVSYIEDMKTEQGKLAAEVGKNPEQGYKMWHEFGKMVNPGTHPTFVSVDFLTTLLDHPYTGDCFLFYLYEKWDPSKDIPTWYFALDGSAESWTERLAPYFPQ